MVMPVRERVNGRQRMKWKHGDMLNDCLFSLISTDRFPSLGRDDWRERGGCGRGGNLIGRCRSRIGLGLGTIAK